MSASSLPSDLACSHSHFGCLHGQDRGIVLDLDRREGACVTVDHRRSACCHNHLFLCPNRGAWAVVAVEGEGNSARRVFVRCWRHDGYRCSVDRDGLHCHCSLSWVDYHHHGSYYLVVPWSATESACRSGSPGPHQSQIRDGCPWIAVDHDCD